MTWDDVARATHSVVKVKYLKSDVKKNLQRKNNIYFKGLGGCIGCNRSQSTDQFHG